MEDVGSYLPRQLLLWCVIILIGCFLQTPLNAATQGKSDRTSSRGTISITLEIPESTRLIADTQNQDVCLHVLDSAINQDTHFYKVVGLNSKLSAEENDNQQAFDKENALLKLNNFYGRSSSVQSRCITPTKISPELVNNNQSILLMLVVE